MFEQIDNKEKAYMLGFIMGGGHIAKNNQSIEIYVQLSDREIVRFISEQLNAKYIEYYKFDKKKRIFPKAGCIIYSKKEKENLIKLYGGRTCEERRSPRISEKLVPYFILGFFDAQGCITWGRRKDRDRLWQKVSFTAQLKSLESIQKMLLTAGISSVIRPKADENCYIIEFSNELDVFKFYNFLPKDSFFLKRKDEEFKKWIEATTKKYTIDENDEVNFIDFRTAKKYNLEKPTYDVSKKFIVDSKGNIKTNSLLLSKKGISNYPLRLELVEISGSISKDVILREV